jgi:hypothetical protein
LKHFNISSQLYSLFSCNFIHIPLHICGFQCLKTHIYKHIYIYSFHILAKNQPWILILWLGSSMKIQCQVGMIPVQMLVWTQPSFPPKLKKRKTKKRQQRILLWETKKIPIAQTTYKVATYLGGRCGVPHGNYVAPLDLEKSTTYYSCMFVTPIESTSWRHGGGLRRRLEDSFIIWSTAKGVR